MRIIIVSIVVIGILSGCAGRGNSIIKEIPSAERILSEMPKL